MRSPRLTLAVLAALSLGGASTALGCVHNSEERQLADLQEEVSHIEARQDRDYQPVSTREAEEALAAKRPPAHSDSVPPVGGQRTINLGEEGDPSGEPASALNGDDPDDTTPRPSIRVSGTRFGRKGQRGAEQVEELLPDETPNGGTAGPAIRANAPTPSALDAEARRSYDASLALVNGHQYDKALDAFAAFLIKWPDHPYADNAMYWRGECYFAKGEFARAAEQFEGTIARFPLGNKVPDAILKLGICQQKLGNAAKAKGYFDRLEHEFPRSEAAHRIPADREASPKSAGPTETP